MTAAFRFTPNTASDGKVHAVAKSMLAILTLIVMLAALPAPPGFAAPPETAPIDRLKGYRGIAFGAPPAPKMELVETDGEVKFYKRANDPLTFGKARLEELIYGYRRDRFFVVIFKTHGRRNSRALLDEFNDRFGTPSHGSSQSGRYTWIGAVNSASFTEGAGSRTAKAAVINNAMDASGAAAP